MDPSFFGYSLDDFKDEARELLSRVESVLAGLKGPRDYPDGINALFRAIHSLKGSAAYAGLKDVHGFSHLYESFLGELRNGKIEVDEKVLAMLFRARDYIEDLVFSPENVTIVRLDELKGDCIEKLSAVLKLRGSSPLSGGESSPGARTQEPSDGETAIVSSGTGRPQKEMTTVPQEARALEQLDVIRVTIIRRLKTLAFSLKNRPFQQDRAIKAVRKLESTLLWAFGDQMTPVMQPLKQVDAILANKIGAGELSDLQKSFNSLAQFIKMELDELEADPGRGSGARNDERGMTSAAADNSKPLRKKSPPDEIRGVSEDDIVKITLTKSLQTLSSLLNRDCPDLNDVKRQIARLRDINRWAFDGDEKVDSSLALMGDLVGRSRTGQILSEIKKLNSELWPLFSELSGGKGAERSAPSGEGEKKVKAEDIPPASSSLSAGSTLRVRSEDLESLMKTVGSLSGLDAKELEKLQAQALQLRMVPVGELFSRFPKVVRDLSESLGKDIKLEMSGESVRLDKVIVDKIREPLLHMIRNAADHGVESREEMTRSGKRHGLIRLGAYHEGGQVIIEVSDNGRGISLKKVKKRGLAMGLIKPDDNLDKKNLLDFIFVPGFSTIDEADSVSGRGVGMDVVKEVVSSIQGIITIETKEGEGSTFRMILPLTLAIVRALILEECGNRIGIPVAAVDKVINMTRDEIKGSSFVDKNRLSLELNDEGEAFPLVSFSTLFGAVSEEYKRTVVIVRVGPAHRVALVVDAALERRPLTVQPLDRFARTRFFSSASLVDERLIMLLNVPSLLAA